MTCLRERLTGRGRELWLERFGRASELLFRVCSFRFAAFSSSFLSASSLFRSCMARSSFCSMSVSCRSCASAVLLTPFWASNSRLQWTVQQSPHPSTGVDLWDTSTLLESGTKDVNSPVGAPEVGRVTVQLLYFLLQVWIVALCYLFDRCSVLANLHIIQLKQRCKCLQSPSRTGGQCLLGL